VVGSGLPGVHAERLSVIEHKAMIKPPTEAVHHKPVFKSLHSADITLKTTEKFRILAAIHQNSGPNDSFPSI